VDPSVPFGRNQRDRRRAQDRDAGKSARSRSAQASKARASHGRAITEAEYGGEWITILLRLSLITEGEAMSSDPRIQREAIKRASTAVVELLERGDLVIGRFDRITGRFLVTR
jgi:hypothetical protein